MYFWLCRVFVAARGLSVVVVSRVTLRCGVPASHCSGFSCETQALGARASVVVAWLLCGMWNLPRAGTEPGSPAQLCPQGSPSGEFLMPSAHQLVLVALWDQKGEET